MEHRLLSLPGLVLLRPERRSDHRGFFTEQYNEQALAALGIEVRFVQDNLSFSHEPGTLRGLHFQRPPHAQAKLIAVLTGEVRDAVVDIRKGSPTYGRSCVLDLAADEGWQLFVPPGFLHGYVTRAPDTRVFYKIDAFHCPEAEGAVRWNDPELGIDWGLDPSSVRLSARDETAAPFGALQSPFGYDP